MKCPYNMVYLKTFIIPLILSDSYGLFAQQLINKGKITNARTREAITYATIAVKGADQYWNK